MRLSIILSIFEVHFNQIVMINRILFTLFFAISIASFGQTDKYIEVVVSETVELKAQSAILKITKGSVEDVEDDYSNEYYSDEYYYEDQEYYRMLEESPKKVTEEMHQAFQEAMSGSRRPAPPRTPAACTRP